MTGKRPERSLVATLNLHPRSRPWLRSWASLGKPANQSRKGWSECEGRWSQVCTTLPAAALAWSPLRPHYIRQNLSDAFPPASVLLLFEMKSGSRERLRIHSFNWYWHKTLATLCKLCLSRQGYCQVLIKSVFYCLSPVSFSVSAVSGFVPHQMHPAMLSPLQQNFSSQCHLPSSIGHLLWATLCRLHSSFPPKSLPSLHFSLRDTGLCFWELLWSADSLARHKQQPELHGYTVSTLFPP